MPDIYPLIDPLLRLVPPETGHNLALRALANGLVAADRQPDDPSLSTTLFGRVLPNPVGLAAGFDKNARVFAATLQLGFGFVEVGGVTPLPQPGNPRPRLFRLEEDRAVINRMGFNNDGMTAIAGRLQPRDRTRGMVGVNLASNSSSTDPAADFDALVRVFTPLADYLTVDISCPNTPNGKVFQQRAPLHELLLRLKETRAAAAEAAGIAPPPMLIKAAPDLTDAEKRDIAEVALATSIDGLILCNTTIARPTTLRSPYTEQRGGLSGQPLFDLSTRLLREMRGMIGEAMPIIGVGGIASAEDAYAKIRAGASAVQLYTALVYAGPRLVREIKDGLAALLRRDGFASVAEAVGTEAR